MPGNFDPLDARLRGHDGRGFFLFKLDNDNIYVNNMSQKSPDEIDVRYYEKCHFQENLKSWWWHALKKMPNSGVP